MASFAVLCQFWLRLTPTHSHFHSNSSLFVLADSTSRTNGPTSAGSCVMLLGGTSTLTSRAAFDMLIPRTSRESCSSAWETIRASRTASKSSRRRLFSAWAKHAQESSNNSCEKAKSCRTKARASWTSGYISFLSGDVANLCWLQSRMIRRMRTLAVRNCFESARRRPCRTLRRIISFTVVTIGSEASAMTKQSTAVFKSSMAFCSAAISSSGFIPPKRSNEARFTRTSPCRSFALRARKAARI